MHDAEFEELALNKRVVASFATRFCNLSDSQWRAQSSNFSRVHLQRRCPMCDKRCGAGYPRALFPELSRTRRFYKIQALNDPQPPLGSHPSSQERAKDVTCYVKLTANAEVTASIALSALQTAVSSTSQH